MYIFANFLVYWIIYEKSIKSLVCWSRFDSYRRVLVCLFLFVFFFCRTSETWFKWYTSEQHTYISSEPFQLGRRRNHARPGQRKFSFSGEDRTRDPPVQWLERPIFIVFGGSRVRFSPRNRVSMVSPSFKLKMFTGSVCVLLTSVSLKLIEIKIKLIYATTSSWEKKQNGG